MSTRPIDIPYAFVALVAVSLVAGGCIYEVGLPADGDKQFGQPVPVPGMHQQNAYEDQSNQPIFRDDQPEGMRYPPPRTVAVDGTPRGFEVPENDHTNLENPVPLSESNLEYGRYLYEEQCAVCHGIDGRGNGTIVEAGHYAPNPPTFHNQSMRDYTDGEIYNVITHGYNQMWSYEKKLTEMERWAVVNYVRALQRAHYPDPRDLERVRDR